MALRAGDRLGVYEIGSPLGAGGMGEVYRARDRKLDRDVAIKVLPEMLAADPERIARFEREAKTLAALNEPHIAQIYGVEESNGVRALVMELVDGPTLADRIAQGPIPLDEALPIAKQIAEALEAAHEQGIIHRDLKPANIKVRADGTVKVLDFGLAKAFDPAASSGASATMSPTLSIHATQAGIILGTAAYMAPEQARGKTVDRRADIWAFGCVLYEMLTGRRAFDGDDLSTTLAAVLKSDPEWSALPANAPPSLRHLLGRCLQKDPKERLRDIGDGRLTIADLLTGAFADSPSSAPVRGGPLWRRLGILFATLLVGSIVTGVVVWYAARSTVAPSRVSRLNIVPPNSAALSLNVVSRSIALTPDGSRLLYVGANDTTLFVRPLDQLEATPLVRGASLRDPFVSPDGQWVGFFDGTTALMKVALSGGPAAQVAQLDSVERGATWAPDGTIIFATASAGLRRISADGGAATVLTRLDRDRGEAGHSWPELLPGGEAVLYTVMATKGGLDAASIAVLETRTGQQTTVLRGGTHGQYAPSGQLMYAAAGTLRAIRFDVRRRIATGPSVLVVPQVLTYSTGAIEAALARDGSLAYLAGGAGGELRTLVWVDRQGRETPTGAPPRAYLSPRLSPDGTRVATVVVAQNGDIWTWDLVRSTLLPLTLEPAIHGNPVWTPDGRVVFASDRAGALNLFSKAADGRGVIERLTESPNAQNPNALAPDGTLLFNQRSLTTGSDVMALRMDAAHHVVPLVQTPSDERNGVVSPDGRWLAYEANDTGTFEIYVKPFPAVNSGLWPVSVNGGTQPVWAPKGQELFYLARDGALMRVAVGSGTAWSAGPPTKVIEGRYVVNAGNQGRNYDISADGQRFLMMKATASDPSGTTPQIIVVQHFDEELKRLVPLK